jgi:hypothetical protein
MRNPWFGSLEAKKQMENKLTSGALRYLQSIYNDPFEAKSARLKAAIEALPYETPKLSAVANFDGKEFAISLEKAITRSGVRLIEAKGER